MCSNDRRKFLNHASKITVGALSASLFGNAAFAQSAEFKLKYANNLPAIHPMNVHAKEAADAIRKETNGRVDIQIFPSNQLGSDTDMLSQVRSGAIDFFTISGLILSTLVPMASVNGIGFAFNDYQQVWPAMDGDLGAFIRSAHRKGQFASVRRKYGTTAIARSPARRARSPRRLILKGFKIRVPVSPLWTSLFKAFGAAPASINFSEVYSALQTKIVEGEENPLAVIQTAKLYEVQKYCSMTNHMWDGFWFLASGKTWARLPEGFAGRDRQAYQCRCAQRARRYPPPQQFAGSRIEDQGPGIQHDRPGSLPRGLEKVRFLRRMEAEIRAGSLGDTGEISQLVHLG